jgi:hypothetical protein
MKKLLIVIMFMGIGTARAQVYELERLILDIEKLLQLKNILTDLYKGYEILHTGYSTIKDISKGNFNLHEAFLDGLLLVSPAVKNYQRLADIVEMQANIVSEYKAAYGHFKQDAHFNPDELAYLMNVYNNLVSGSLDNLENLLNVVTASKLRMSDAERLHAIDGIYTDTKDKLMFLRQFNTKTMALAIQRTFDEQDIGTLQQYYNLK